MLLVINHAKPNPSINSKSEAAYFDLHDVRGDIPLYYFSLIFNFHYKGYVVYVKNNFRFISNCDKNFKVLFGLKHVYISNKLPNSTRRLYYFHDHKSTFIKGIKKTIFLNPDIYNGLQGDSIQMPSPMSPAIYLKGQSDIEKNRKKRRAMKIFFSGNQDKEYDNPIFETFFRKVNRYKASQILINTLMKQELLLIEGSIQWEELKKSYQNKLVLNYWIWSRFGSKNLDSRVNEENWLKTLSQSDFFLALPGIRIPLSFNIVEAMSVGTIPILEYSEIFHPQLTHMKNCIIYDGKEDLISKIRNVLKMKANEIAVLKRYVIQYYENHLSTGKVCDMIERDNSPKLTLYINSETSLLYLDKHNFSEMLKNDT